MRRTDSGIFYVERAQGPVAPVIFDSPHSGQSYPKDFDYLVPDEVIRCAEDMFVDELFGDAPYHGAILLAALFPRSYIDPNRALCDLDEELLDEPWPEPLLPGEKTRQGHGLIWYTCPPDLQIYNRKLTGKEVRRRIDNYYLAYHGALGKSFDRLHHQFGHVWHVNCHSMPTFGLSATPGNRSIRRPEFVLGDRDGTTCEPEFTSLICKTLESFGYSVRINSPYKGVELVRAFSNPAAGRHSIQIEVSRALYMDESTFEQNDGFEELKSNLSRLAGVVCSYAREKATNSDGAVLSNPQTVR